MVKIYHLLVLTLLFGCSEDKLKPTSEVQAEVIFKNHFASIGLNVTDVPVTYTDDWDRWTSVVFVDGTCYRAYINAEGDVTSLSSQPILPLGHQRVLSVIVDYPNLDFEANFEHWTAAQNYINEKHRIYGDELGIEPIVQFANDHVFIEPEEVTSYVSTDIYNLLTLKGVPYLEYDIIALVDLDTENPSGGFAVPEGEFMKIGWFFNDETPKTITTERMIDVAKAVYHHEIGHLWGWEHEWSDADTTEVFITKPSLFGWTDLDGDGVIEILDETPYGIDN